MNICVINPDVHIKMKMVGLKKYVQKNGESQTN